MELKNKLLITGLSMMLSAPIFADQAQQTTDIRAIQNQYSAFVENGKTFKDAYAALAYEIAYENAAVQATKPCRKMVRGL
ncbi:hypothetical protein [Thiomicrorhabdus sp. Milos-T2]|uniref:hypothetical protein n=1 Tax=Thiomicrorhabdus sp. Milos-T2 TaxID=90814 RepID=UPI0004947BD1|nr:hypothetical protein [Thiomicrorhabdus sp. Milos-T2]